MKTKPKRPPMVEKMKKRLSENPKVTLANFNIPLENGLETPKLKDVLEDNVDEKYYLDHKIVSKIIEQTDFKERLVSIKIGKDKK